MRSTAGKPASGSRPAILLRGIEARRAGKAVDVPRAFVDAFARVLRDGPQDPAFAAEALGLPSETYLAEQMDVVDPDAIHAVRTHLRRELARTLRDELARDLPLAEDLRTRTAPTRNRPASGACATWRSPT